MFSFIGFFYSRQQISRRIGDEVAWNGICKERCENGSLQKRRWPGRQGWLESNHQHQHHLHRTIASAKVSSFPYPTLWAPRISVSNFTARRIFSFLRDSVFSLLAFFLFTLQGALGLFHTKCGSQICPLPGMEQCKCRWKMASANSARYLKSHRSRSCFIPDEFRPRGQW